MNIGMKYKPRHVITTQNTHMKAMKPHTSFSFIPTTDSAGITYRGCKRFVHSSPNTETIQAVNKVCTRDRLSSLYDQRTLNSELTTL